MVKPATIFGVWTPDEAAELLDGMPADLYMTLWHLLPKDGRTRSLSHYWSKLLEEDQERLNELAERFNAYWES